MPDFREYDLQALHSAVGRDPLGRSSPGTAAAAAAVLLSSVPPPAPHDRLEAALQAVAPHLTGAEVAAWIASLTEPLHRGGITAPRCVAAFLGQCAVESGGFRCLEENLSYSVARLCQVWPGRFPDTAAAELCAGQPEVLANRVYANRMGNGDEESGDGWQFRGRGLIQITGRAAYRDFARAMNMTPETAAAHAGTKDGAVDSAIWFWTTHQLNALAQAWSIDPITRKINGGTAGAAERNRLCDAALHVLGA
jgi:putative chitinase